MNQAPRLTTTVDSSLEQPLNVLKEHRERFERLAESELPIAEDAQRGLDVIEEVEG